MKSIYASKGLEIADKILTLKLGVCSRITDSSVCNVIEPLMVETVNPSTSAISSSKSEAITSTTFSRYASSLFRFRFSSTNNLAAVSFLPCILAFSVMNIDKAFKTFSSSTGLEPSKGE